jgi:phosphoribosyl 1,2-cyclic phosphodiesterase
MRLKVIGTGSRGNCYIFQNNAEALILEAGVTITEIKKALNFSFKTVVAAVVSHEHQDHSKSINDLLQMGVDVYTSRGTMRALALQVNHHRLHTIKAAEVFQVGNFKIMPFAIEHDCVEPLGFIINHAETGNVLFITDSYYVKDRFKNIHNILIEANYCQTIIDKKVAAGASPEFLRNRIFKSHMSLATCKQTLLANDLSKVRNIVLIHLSDSNSDAARFKTEIENITGKVVHVADNGYTIENFSKTAF